MTHGIAPTILKKSYKHSGSKDSDIQQAITALESAGCVRRYSEYDGEYNYSFSMSGASSCSVRVIIPDNEGVADIGNEKIIGLKDGEYVYEVYITRDYEHEN